MIAEKSLNKANFYYQIFMEKAGNLHDPNIPGYHACVMKNLIIAEKGEMLSVTIMAFYEEQIIGPSLDSKLGYRLFNLLLNQAYWSDRLQ